MRVRHMVPFMEEHSWTDDHVSYVLAVLVADISDSHSDLSLGAEVMTQKMAPNGAAFRFVVRRPADPADDGGRIALSQRQLADFYEGLPSKGKTVWSAEEVLAWRAEHRIPPAEIDAVMQREVPEWWAGERAHSAHCVLNERGEALAEWFWGRPWLPGSFADYVEDPYTA